MRAIAIAIVLWSSAAAAQGAAALDPIVTLPSTTFEVGDVKRGAPPPTLLVEVIPRPDVALSPAAEVVDVALGPRHELSWLEKFPARLVSKDTHWWLALTPPLDALDGVGTYTVAVRVGGTRSEKRVEQRIELQLIRPAAELEIRPARLVMERVGYGLWW